MPGDQAALSCSAVNIVILVLHNIWFRHGGAKGYAFHQAAGITLRPTSFCDDNNVFNGKLADAVRAVVLFGQFSILTRIGRSAKQAGARTALRQRQVLPVPHVHAVARQRPYTCKNKTSLGAVKPMQEKEEYFSETAGTPPNAHTYVDAGVTMFEARSDWTTQGHFRRVKDELAPNPPSNLDPNISSRGGFAPA
jgi:hypothetical protein